MREGGKRERERERERQNGANEADIKAQLGAVDVPLKPLR